MYIYIYVYVYAHIGKFCLGGSGGGIWTSARCFGVTCASTLASPCNSIIVATEIVLMVVSSSNSNSIHRSSKNCRNNSLNRNGNSN